MTILVDCDDVIFNLLPNWVNYLNKKYDLFVDPTEIKNWDLSLAFPTLSNEQICEPLSLESFWDNVKPIPGAIESLEYLHSKGHTIYIVTATHYGTIYNKMTKMILKYMPEWFDYKNLIIAYNKGMIIGDVLIDDYVNNLSSFRGKRILLNKSYNNNVSTDIIVVNDWDSIVDVLDSLDKYHKFNKLY